MKRMVFAPLCLFLAFAAPAWAESGTFKISVCGFKCVAETIDHMLQVDGKRDEVWLAIFAKRHGKLYSGARTQTMGDVGGDGKAFPGRVAAGSAASGFENGINGGVQTGDSFPPAPFAAAAPLPAHGWTSRFPLPGTVWEGDLTKGEEGISFGVALFEDDLGDAETWRGVMDLLNNEAVQKAIDAGIASASGGATTGLPIGKLAPGIAGGFGQASDRMVGQAPMEIIINYESALKASRESQSGLPVGVIAVELVDDPKFNQGHYIVWIKIEQVGEANQVDQKQAE